MLFNVKFILASNSKSRAFILKNNKLDFIQIPPSCKEEIIKKKNIEKKNSPKAISFILAKSKAKSIAKIKPNSLVVGSDTIIEFNKKIRTKAKNIKEAKNKIKKLSGKKHKIYSSAVVFYKKKMIWKTTQQTTVKIRKLNKHEIDNYLKQTNKNILLSVGCFQIEKDGPNIIEKIYGDFFNVMGFPLFPFLVFLKKFNIKK